MFNKFNNHLKDSQQTNINNTYIQKKLNLKNTKDSDRKKNNVNESRVEHHSNKLCTIPDHQTLKDQLGLLFIEICLYLNF